MQLFDLLLLALLGWAAVGGWRRGFAVVVLGYAGLLAGLALGAVLATQVGLFVSAQSSAGRLLIGILVFVLVAGVCHALGLRVGTRARSSMEGRWTGSIDTLGGALAAAAMAAVAMWFVALMLGNTPLSPLSRAVSNSTVLRAIDQVAPRPPAALAQLRGLLAPFPEAFATLRPPSAAGPPPAVARTRGVTAAAAGTVQVMSRGCGGMVFGSGFPVETGLVVTNAHVVAGTRDHRVVLADGRRHEATLVWLDPERDVALLRAPTLRLAPLPIREQPAGEGTTGAVIGYPGGGDRTVVGARVGARTTALGRDIYSRSLVRREIYVLRATIRQGDSGGPLVDPQGRVLGLVFAASTSDPQEGYALTAEELGEAIAEGTANRGFVDPGRCAA